MSQQTSSPLSSLPNSQLPPPPSTTPLCRKTYHPAQPLPFELDSHITIYFEENLYAQAFSLLQSLVTSSAHADPNQPTYTPTLTQLALASTLSVHPALTTRTTNPEKQSHADSALRLLRIVGQVLGPINADFRGALRFTRSEYQSSSSRTRNGVSEWYTQRKAEAAGERERGGYSDYNGGGDGGGRHLHDARIDNAYAQDESLYARGEDFWHVVGWAFNCSKLHVKRWGRWVVWLQWMVGVLEDDWRCRQQPGAEPGGVSQSLIWLYIKHAAGGRGRNRRILRAIFANGSTKAVNEFREVFRNELAEPSKEDLEKKSRKRRVHVDVDAEVYGDYMGKDEGEASEDGAASARFTRRTRTRDVSLKRLTPKASASSLNSGYEQGEEVGDDGPAILGGGDSLKLRMRLLQLLSDVSFRMPHEYETRDELYAMLVEFIRPLPLAAFQAIISPAAVPEMLSAEAQTTLGEFLLTRSLLEAAAPATDEPYLRQSKLEECYLPFAATSSSVADNAKVSLCLESLLRHLFRAGKLVSRPALEYSVHEGIQNRCAKAGDGAKKHASARRDEVAWAWLLASGERLTDLLHRVQSRNNR